MVEGMEQAEIDNRFAFHPATDEEKRNDHTSMREACKVAAERIIEKTPPGREQSLAITKLEEAMFWANAAVARPQVHPTQ